MNRIIDRFILLIYCLGSGLFVPKNTAFLVAFLIASIYGCLDYYMKGWKYKWFMNIAMIVLTIFMPECCLFLPLALYGSLEDKKYFFSALFIVIGIFHYIPESFSIMFFLIVGDAIAILFEYKTSAYDNLYKLYKQTRDDSTERNILLKEKNQALLEKQDYEIYTATLKERNRIAREIHDNVGHMLSRAILMNGALKAINKDETLANSLEQMESTLNTAMTNVRESVHDLHDDSIDLKDVLEGLVKDFHFCPVELYYDMGYEVPRNIKYCFISIAKEALNNIIRHSNATKVSLIAREHPGLYQLIIEDNGTTAPSENTGKGMGLLNMHDRVDAIGGRIQITKKQGFHIFITIPKKEEL